MSEHRTTEWIKAQASNANGSCVEMRRNGSVVEVRDTKACGAGPTLALSPAEFSAWVAAAKRNEFDHLS